MTGSSAMRLVVRRTWREGWRSQLVLAITLAVAVGVVVGVLAGAQRAESALDRLRARTHAGDLAVGSDTEVEALVAQVATARGVTAVGAVREFFVRPKGSDLFPDYNLLPLAPWPTKAGGTVDTPVIVSGRAPNPAAIGEVALSEALASALKLHVGDHLTLESMTNAWVDSAYNGGDPGPPDGPVVPVTVVGLARSPVDFGRWTGLIHLTPAFAKRYLDEIRVYTFAEARLTKPLAARVQAGEQISLPGPSRKSDEVQPSFFTASTATQDGLRTISTSLRLIAAASALAGLTAIGLTTLRLARTALAARVTLVAIGWTRGAMARLVVIVLAPWVAAGTVAGVVGGVLASPLASVGLAKAVDPARRAIVIEAGWVVWAAAATALTTTAVVVLSALRASRPAGRPSTAERPLPPLARPLAATLGVRRAFFGAQDRGGRASRSAMVAAMAGVAVAVAALLVGSSIARLQVDPSLSGQGSVGQRVIDAGEDPTVYTRAMALLDGDQRAVDLIGLNVAFGISAPRAGGVTALVFDVHRGDPSASILRGRLPAQPDEVAVGPATLDKMRLAVGDAVRLTSESGRARFQIVGEVLFPEGDFAHDSGVALTLAGAHFLGGLDGTAIHQVAFSWGASVDAKAADRGLADAGFKPFSTFAGLKPAVVTNLGQVRSLPALLAALVMALGLITVVHGVAQTTRLRRREAGTLRALGVTPRVVGATVVAQGATVALVAVLGGIPLGLAAGRQVWTLIATRAYVVDHPVPAWIGMGWLALAATVGTLVLAVLPAIRSSRERPASALRAE